MQSDMNNQSGSSGGSGTMSAGSVNAGVVVDEVKAAARDVADTAKQSVAELKEEVSERATGSVNEKKHALADSLESLVTALRAAEKALRDDSQESLATYSSSLATYVERSSGYVRNNDMSGLMNDLQRVGRENTGVFMGGSFVAGAALGRFLRASTPSPETGEAMESNTMRDDRSTGSDMNDGAMR